MNEFQVIFRAHSKCQNKMSLFHNIYFLWKFMSNIASMKMFLISVLSSPFPERIHHPVFICISHCPMYDFLFEHLKMWLHLFVYMSISLTLDFELYSLRKRMVSHHYVSLAHNSECDNVIVLTVINFYPTQYPYILHVNHSNSELGHMTRYGQQDVSKCDANMGLKCACVIGQLVLAFFHYYENMPMLICWR